MAVTVVGCFTSVPGGAGADGGSEGGGTAARGCTVQGTTPPTAPGGYYTHGATVCTASGTPYLFHGVDRPSLEFTPTGIGPAGASIPASDFAAMASWHANVVRIATNQDFWLKGAYLHNNVPTGSTWSVSDAENYQATVYQAVQDAEAAGLNVILDLHWSDEGNLGVKHLQGEQDMAGYSAQQPMADVNSQQFWSEVAQQYKGDGHVIFELYNEPNNISWEVWLNGGTATGYNYTAVGMQQLYDTVRAAGAENLVIAGGLNWAFDLSGVATTPIVGHNIMYATHDYPSNDQPTQWQGSFGYLLTGDIAPVIATEFGDTEECSGSWDTSLIQFAATNSMSWTAWAWFPGGCSQFPSLLDDFTYATTAQGVTVKQALLLFPAPTPLVDAGPEAAPPGDGASDHTSEDAPSDGAHADGDAPLDESSHAEGGAG